MGVRQSIQCCAGELKEGTPRSTLESSVFHTGSSRSYFRTRPISYRSYLSHDDLNPDSSANSTRLARAADTSKALFPLPGIKVISPGGTVEEPKVDLNAKTPNDKTPITRKYQGRKRSMAIQDLPKEVSQSNVSLCSSGLDKSCSSHQSEVLMDWSPARDLLEYEGRAADDQGVDEVDTSDFSRGSKNFSKSTSGRSIGASEMSDSGCQPDGRTIQRMIIDSITKFAGQQALMDGISGQAWTYVDLGVCVRRVASGLKRAGLRPGHRLVLVSPTCPEAAIIMLSTFTLGATFVPLSSSEPPNSLLDKLRKVKPTIVMTSLCCNETTLWAAGCCSSVKRAYEMGGSSGKCYPFSRLLDDDGTACPDTILNGPDDVAIIAYSTDLKDSGQLIEFTYSNIVEHIHMITESKQMCLDGAGEVLLVALPLTEPFVLVGLICTGLKQGYKVVTMPHWEPKRVLKLCQQIKATILPLSSQWISILGKQPEMRRGGLLPDTALVYGGATSVDPSQLQVLRRLGAKRVVFAYGLAETLGPVAACLAMVSPATSLLPLDGVVFKVTEEKAGKTLGVSERGNVQVSCPLVASRPYISSKEHGSYTDTNGLIPTGDIGHLDSRGSLYVVGHKEACVMFQGKELWLDYLERILRKHLGIADTAILATDTLTAAVVLRPGYGDVTAKDLCQFAHGQQGWTEHLENVLFVSNIPRSGSGRILRQQLSEEMSQQVSCTVPWTKI